LRTTSYTCVTSGYDRRWSAIGKQKGIDHFVAFTDDLSCSRRGWQVNGLMSPPSVKRLDLVNRYHKLFPLRLLKDTELSIYIDGNIELIRDLRPLVDQFLDSGKVLGCFKHPQRSNIQEEMEACLLLDKFKGVDKRKSREQVAVYLGEGFPLEIPLQAATVLFRRHDEPRQLSDAMTLWWKQLLDYTARDQISLPYVLWKTELPFISFDLNIFSNEFFVRHPHR
jgi:hypothetical protein